jgi:hypothetical protein
MRRRRRIASSRWATRLSATRSTPTTGTNIRANRRREITDSVLQQLDEMKTHPWMRGSIVLLHDGGGNRAQTVAALPLLITTLRAKGYEIVPVSELMGKTTAEVMPPISPKMRWQARIDWVAFFFFSFFANFVVDIFFIGDVLMSARLVLVGVFATIDRFPQAADSPWRL